MKGPSCNGTEAPVANGGEAIATKPEAAKTKKAAGDEILANPMLKLQEAVEKKLRNLEKRRGKLVVIKDEKDKGTKLTEEQVEAVSKLGEVEQQIEFVRDLQKTIGQQTRQYSRAARQRDESEKKKRRQADHERLQTLVRYQQVVGALGKDEVRDAFAHGKAGATKLDEKELTALDKLSDVLLPSLDAVNSTEEWNKSLETATGGITALLNKTDAKVAADLTGTHAVELFDKIISSELFQSLPIRIAHEEEKPVVPEKVEVPVVNETVPESKDNGVSEEANVQKEQLSGAATPTSELSNDASKSPSPQLQVVPIAADEPPKNEQAPDVQSVLPASASPPAPADASSTNTADVTTEIAKEASVEPVQNGQPAETKEAAETKPHKKISPRKAWNNKEQNGTADHKHDRRDSTGNARRTGFGGTGPRGQRRGPGQNAPRSPPAHTKPPRRPSQTNGTGSDNEPKEHKEASPAQPVQNGGNNENSPPAQPTENGTAEKTEQPRSPKPTGGLGQRFHNKFNASRGRPSDVNGGPSRARPEHGSHENGNGFRRSFNGPRKDFDSRPPRQDFENRPPRKDFENRGPRKDFDNRPPRKDYENRPPRHENGGPSQRPQFRDSNDGSYRPRPARSNNEDGPPHRSYNNGPRNNDYQQRPQRPKYEYGFRFAAD